MGNFMTTVGNDQISYFQASLKPRFLVPNIVGVLMLIGGIVGLVVVASRSSKSRKRRESLDGTEVTTMKMSGGVVASLSVVGASVLVLAGTNIALAVMHPRAAAEQMVAGQAANLLGEII